MLKPMYEYGIGKTPLLELPMIHNNRIFLKLESRNYLGSIKARTAYGIVRNLNVPRDRIIVESTSGNLGLALNFFCKEEGRPFLCLLDETVIRRKQQHLEKCGVAYEIVPVIRGLDGRTSRIKRAGELMQNEQYYWVNQYDNEDGVLIHQETTGREILEDTDGSVTCVICAVGSGGTIAGIGEYFKSVRAAIKLIGVEPYGSTIFHTHEESYITAGAGLRGKPGNIQKHLNVVTDSMAIKDEVSLKKFSELNNLYSANVGITTGMAYAAAEQYCQQVEKEVIVIIAPDGMEMYNEYM